MSKDKLKKNYKFEEALAKLEHAVDALENDELELESALKLYEEGMELSQFCDEKLNEVKKRIDVLQDGKKGMERKKFEV